MSLIDYKALQGVAATAIKGVGTPAVLRRIDSFTQAEIILPVSVVLPTVKGGYKDGGSITGKTIAAFPADGPVPAAGDLLVVNGRKFRLHPVSIAAPTGNIPLVYKCELEEVI